MQLTIGHDCRDLTPLENLVASSGANFQTITSLSVLPAHTSPDTYIAEVSHRTDKSKKRTRLGKVDQPGKDSLNVLLRMLLSRIPRNHLNVSSMYLVLLDFIRNVLIVQFSWLHEYFIEGDTLLLLAKYHSESLQQLRYRQVMGDKADSLTMPGLQSLDISFIVTTTFRLA